MGICEIDFMVPHDIEKFRRFYNEVLKPEFPNEDECESFEDFLTQASRMSAISNKCWFVVYVVSDDIGNPIAGLIADYFYDSNTCIIEYTAVKEDYKNTGIGSMLVEDFTNNITETVFWDYGKLVDYIFWECENPNKYLEEDIIEKSIRRWNFFNKLGAKKVDMEYIQPALNANKSNVDYLDLWVLPTMNTKHRLTLPKSKLRRFLSDYFKYSISSSTTEKEDIMGTILNGLNDEVELITVGG